MKSTELSIGKLSSAMLDALVRISRRNVTILRSVGFDRTYSVTREGEQESDIKIVTVDALNGKV